MVSGGSRSFSGWVMTDRSADFSDPVFAGPLKWWEWVKKHHCPHVHVRGIYGDEINHTSGYRRLQCLNCGRLLDGPVSISWGRKAADD